MTAPDLKPCPFCGHHPHLWGDTSGEYQIECVNGSCPSEPSVWMQEKDEVIAAWNTRTTPLAEALAVPEVAALLGAVRRFEMLMQTQIRTADFHGGGCGCIRCAEDDMFSALRAITQKGAADDRA